MVVGSCNSSEGLPLPNPALARSGRLLVLRWADRGEERNDEEMKGSPRRMGEAAPSVFTISSIKEQPLGRR